MTERNQLRHIREDAGLTQETMAGRLGIQRTSLSYMENQPGSHHKYQFYVCAYHGAIKKGRGKKK